jgi:nucleotide-binding universal stress UspA family protein
MNMTNILLPVDGSDNALRAVRELIEKRDWFHTPVELHLLNVQMPIVSGLVKSFISVSQLESYYRDQGLAALAPARSVLDQAGMPFQHHIGVGGLAETILDYAREKQSGLIIMGTHGRGAVGNVLLGSVASRVLHEAQIPVLLVS